MGGILPRLPPRYICARMSLRPSSPTLASKVFFGPGLFGCGRKTNILGMSLMEMRLRSCSSGIITEPKRPLIASDACLPYTIRTFAAAIAITFSR